MVDRAVHCQWCGYTAVTADQHAKNRTKGKKIMGDQRKKERWAKKEGNVKKIAVALKTEFFSAPQPRNFFLTAQPQFRNCAIAIAVAE